MGQGVQGCGCSPLNSFLRKSRSCARPRGSVRSSLKLKPQRSTRSFVGVCTLWATPALGQAWPHPPLAPHVLGWRGEQGLAAPPRGHLRGGIHGPVRGVVCDPGVAGQAARHDGVMGHVLLIELDVPARGSGWRRPGPPSHRCHQPQPPWGRAWTLRRPWSLGSAPHQG